MGGPDISVTSFAGRWLPKGEGPKRENQLVVTCRETIGWKYGSKPPMEGEEGKPTASRKVGLIVRALRRHGAARGAAQRAGARARLGALLSAGRQVIVCV